VPLSFLVGGAREDEPVQELEPWLELLLAKQIGPLKGRKEQPSETAQPFAQEPAG
jgi:hypothetical protein